MFYLYIERFFYEGTLFAPKSGALDKTFSTKEEAIKYAKTIFGELRWLKGHQYYPDGIYVLSHGEYEKPTIKIRKVRKQG